MSKAPAPISPTSSFGVKRSSTPACGLPSSTIRRAASIIATTADLLSAPRIVPPALRTIPSSPTTGSRRPCGGTVSRCAQRKIGVPPPPRPGRRQSRFPIVEPVAVPVSSSSTSSPSACNSSSTRSATSRSSPGGLAIAASSRKSGKMGDGDFGRKMYLSCVGVAEPLIQATLLAEALENGPVAVFVVGDDLRYIAVNQYACTLLGYTRAELL